MRTSHLLVLGCCLAAGFGALAAAGRGADPAPPEATRPDAATRAAGAAAVGGTVTAESEVPLDEMVVYLESPDADRPMPPPGEAVNVSQKGARFEPKLTVVTVGQTVNFPNNEDREIEHNVFSSSKAKKFDLGLYGPDQSKSVTFDKPGPVLLRCSIHRFMDGVVFVSPTPYWSLVDKDGGYKMRGRAAGQVDAQDVAGPPPVRGADAPAHGGGGQTVNGRPGAEKTPMTRRRPFNTAIVAACAGITAHALVGCAAAPRRVRLSRAPAPRRSCSKWRPRPSRAKAKANRFARVPVYDVAPRPAAPPTGQFELVDYSALDDIIVWLESAGAGDAATAAAGTAGSALPPLVVDIDARVHPDDVRAAAVGQELVFRNRGAEPVALYSVSDDNDFELPEIPPGGEARYTVPAEGMIEVLAGSADPPVATVYAAPSSWVARTRSGGRVVFDDVAPGSYNVVSWHPRLPGSTAPVSLEPGAVARVALKVGVNVLGEDQP